jgi:hypothetical protein
MSEACGGDLAPALWSESLDCDPQIAALRAAGAQELDALRLHFLEVLSARAQAQSGRVKRILQDKLALAVADFQARLAQAQSAAGEGVAEAQSQAQIPIAPSQPGSLGDLVRAMAQEAPEQGEAGWQATLATGPELRSVRLFRNTWSKLSADQQLNTALDRAPQNAGPINSHMLVLRSLALMRALSPDYLNRFISYADTLIRLEQAEQTKPALPGADAAGGRGKKPKPKPKPRRL